MVEPLPGDADSTRRALLRSSGAGLATAAVLSLSACGGSSHRPDVRTIPAPVRELDVQILNDLLDRAQRTIAAYTASVPLFDGHLHEAGKQFLDQDLAHAGELYRLIKQARGDAAKPRPSYELGHPRGRRDLIALLHALEGQMLASCLAALPTLSPGSVRAAVASILANDAQHLAVLRLAVRMDPIPVALPTGAP